jgi:hypothetical protein
VYFGASHTEVTYENLISDQHWLVARRIEMEADKMNYPVDIESLHRNFPSHCEVTDLLADFGEWLRSRGAGSVGYFRFQSERPSDYWIENGADLHPWFAFFMKDPTGGEIGYWMPDGKTIASPPVVSLGSEGEVSVMSETLEGFLALLANRATGHSDLDSRSDDGRDEGAELAAWLKLREVRVATGSSRNFPDLKKWLDNWAQQQRQRIENDPVHIQITEKLRKYLKPNAKPWERTAFDVLLVGTQFKMWRRSFGPKLMADAEVADLESLFRAARLDRARHTPDRGLWFSAWVTVGAEGAVNLSCNFMDEPKIADEHPAVPIADYERDLKDFPRSEYWMPWWLKERIG